MKINIHAIGKTIPGWAEEAISVYLKRFSYPFQCSIHTFSTPKRSKSVTPSQCIKEESDLLNKSLINTHACFTIALTERGQQLNSADFFSKIQSWQNTYPSIDFLLGGPDGLSRSLEQAAHYKLSLSAMTLPHALARLVLIEQLYRAFTHMNNHPYHRV